jgi:hypothetical protein
MTDADLESFGVDWEALSDPRLLSSQFENNDYEEGDSSWIRRPGPPENLGGVVLDPPSVSISLDNFARLDAALQPWLGSSNDSDIVTLWSVALSICQNVYPSFS